jgi:hypothetical protein
MSVNEPQAVHRFRLVALVGDHDRRARRPGRGRACAGAFPTGVVSSSPAGDEAQEIGRSNTRNLVFFLAAGVALGAGIIATRRRRS